ncbi:MAG TPA: 50S ribosomal protein L18 [Thermomicrobiales bacterium]|nr:50S ribosomal protein L18 [Thermomicrobiales bacterium]
MRYHYKSQLNARRRRHLRVRAKVSGSTARPRLNVYRSSAHIYAQVIDDTRGHTIVAASSREPEVAGRLNDATTKSDKAKVVGLLIGERARDAGVSSVVFDRGGYKFHGRVKAVADGAREAGLNF